VFLNEQDPPSLLKMLGGLGFSVQIVCLVGSTVLGMNVESILLVRDVVYLEEMSNV
jgi:hypothetical protein